MKTQPDRHHSETTARLRNAPRHLAVLLLGLTVALSPHSSKAIPVPPCNNPYCNTYEDPRIRVEIAKIQATSDEVILNYRLRQLNNSGTHASYLIYAQVSEDLKVWMTVLDSGVEGFLSGTPESVLQGSVTFEKPAGKQMFFRLYAEASLVGG